MLAYALFEFRNRYECSLSTTSNSLSFFFFFFPLSRKCGSWHIALLYFSVSYVILLRVGTLLIICSCDKVISGNRVLYNFWTTFCYGCFQVPFPKVSFIILQFTVIVFIFIKYQGTLVSYFIYVGQNGKYPCMHIIQ